MSLPASRTSGRRLMLLSAACFVANVLLIRALGTLAGDVWMISALRFATGLAVCLACYRRELDPVALFTRPRLILRGLVGAAGTYGLYVTIVELGAGRAVFINNTYVALAGLLAVPLLGEPFRRPLVLGATAALAGLGLLTGVFLGDLRAGLHDGLGVLVALASAWIVVAIRQLHREGVASATIFASQCIYGLLLCAPFILSRGLPPPAPVLLGLVVAGLCAAVGQLAMTHAYRALPVAEGALLQTLVPLGIAAGGVAFFGEALAWPELAGGLLIVSGSVLPMLPARNKKQDTPAN